jgi:hypothetical protein
VSLEWCFGLFDVEKILLRKTILNTTIGWRRQSSIILHNAKMEAKSSSDQKGKTQEPVLKPFTKKNWDAIIDEFEKEEEKELGVNELFKKIYESGSEETRKAMNKSFQESAGTVLSTNWDSVANKRVEPKPPS